ncbi:MAG TPA: DUF4352 domain-containing protein [Blastocatellia bacterium]|nr:DUF4352 domain-containing protein [Blastocatellia bacterium]
MTVGTVAAIGISLLAMLAVLNRRDQFVGLNQEIQYDDFAFSVQGVRTTNSLGSGEFRTRPQGLYYIISLKIANHAKRVDFRFKYESAKLIDIEDKQFGLSPAGQRALEAETGKRCDKPIPAGASCVTEVVFDLPADAELKHFRISEGGLVGDILNVIFYGKKRIELSSIQ